MKVLIQLVMVLIAVQVSETSTDRDLLRLSSGIILRYEGSAHLINGIYNGILVVDLPEVKLPRMVQIYCKPGSITRDRRILRAPLNSSETGERNATMELDRNANFSKPIKTWDQVELEIKNGSSTGCGSSMQQKQLQVGVSMITGYHRRIGRLQRDILKAIPEGFSETTNGRRKRETSMWHVINPIFWQSKLWDLLKGEDEIEEVLKHIKIALNNTADALEAGENMMNLLWQKSNVMDTRMIELTDEIVKTVSKLDMGIRIQQISVDMLAEYDMFMFQSISAYADYENNFVQIKNSVQALMERGKLDPLLVPVNELESLLRDVRETLKTTLPTYKLAHESTEYYFKNARVTAFRNKNKIAIYVPMPLVKKDHGDAWDLYKTEIIDIPIDNETDHTTRMINLKEFYLISADKMKMVEYGNRPEINDQMIEGRGIVIKPTIKTCIRALILANRNATKRDCNAVMILENLKPQMKLIKNDKVLLTRIKEYSVELATGEVTRYQGCTFCYITIPCMAKITAHGMILYTAFVGCLKSKKQIGVTWHIRNEHILDHMFRSEELAGLTEQGISLEPLEVNLPSFDFETDGKEILAHDQEHRISLQKLDGHLREQKKLYRTAESKLRDEIKQVGQAKANESIFESWVTYAIGILGTVIVIVVITVYCKFKGASSMIVLISFATMALGKAITHGTEKETGPIETIERNETNDDGSKWYDVHVQILNHTAFFPTVMSTLTILTMMVIAYQIYKLRKNNRALQIRIYLLFADSGEETIQVLYRTWPLAIYRWTAESYFNEHTITWNHGRATLWYRWPTLECKNCSRENMKLILPEQIKISYWQAYKLRKMFKTTHHCSLVLIDAERIRKAIKVEIKGETCRAEEENLMQINDIGQPMTINQVSQPSAPLEQNNLGFLGDSEERRVLFGKVYYAE